MSSSGHPYFYTYKNSKESFGAREELDTEPGVDKRHGFESEKQRTSTDRKGSFGNQTAVIVTASVVAVAMVIAITVVGIRAWKKRTPERESQWLLSYKRI